MNCPKCGESCGRDEVDVGVGIIHGPYGCYCGWSEDPYYDCSEGPSPASAREPTGRFVTSRGVSHSIDRIAETLSDRFGLSRGETAEALTAKDPAP